MANILIIGGITFNDLVYLDTFPEPTPKTVFSKQYHSTIGGTGAGKSLNLNRLAHDVTLHGFIGNDAQGEQIRRMITVGKELVICTHGKDGATGLTRSGVWSTVPAIDTKLIDSNGAGDSFFSGVLHGYLQGYSLQTCMELGTVTAAMCVGSRELFSPELSPERLQALYEEYFDAGCQR